MFFSWSDFSQLKRRGDSFDHDLKFKRVEEHLWKLYDVTTRWIYFDKHCAIRYERDPDNGLLIVLATAEEPPRDPISILIGDALHNMRSGLDNLADALAAAHTQPLPPDFADTAEFPIFGDIDRHGTPGTGSSRFHRSTKGVPDRGSGIEKIRGMCTDAQDIIERLQPYHRGNAFPNHPLWRVHELDRFNKHRIMHTTVAHTQGTSIDGLKSFNYTLIDGSWESIEGPIGTDTPIARLNVQPTDPTREMHVEVEPQLRIAFPQTAPCMQYVPAAEALAESYLYIVTEVLPLLAPFL